MKVTGTLQREAWDAKTLPPVERVTAGLWSIPVPIPDNPLRYVLVYALELANGRRAAQGPCPVCGTKINRILGKKQD